MSQIKAVIFDMDGVLIDSEIVYIQFMLEFIRSKRPETSIEELYGIVGQAPEPAWTIIKELLNSTQDWQELRQEYYKEWYPQRKAKIDYRKIFRPEAEELIRELKEQGYRLAVASSTEYTKVIHILELNGILSYFDVVLSGQDLPRSKPDPMIYHKAAKLLGVKEEECVVLEDSTVGIRAAYDAGMRVTALKDERFSFDQSLAYEQIENLKELRKCLSSCE